MSENYAAVFYRAAAYEHCKDRAKRRYNFDLQEYDFNAMVEKIIDGRGVRVHRSNKHDTIWRVKHCGITFTVVFMNKGVSKKFIKTFLPSNWCEKRGLWPKSPSSRFTLP